MVSVRVSTTAEIMKLFSAEKTMAAEENRFAVQERILGNKTWQDFSEICWLFLIKQLFHSGLLDMR